MIKEKKTVNIVNPKQAQLYIKNGLEPIRVYWSGDRICYIFDREKSYPLFTKWCNYELE